MAASYQPTVIREIHIPGIGGPFIEISTDSWIRLEYSLEFESATGGFDEMQSSLTGVLLMSAGFIAGWLGHSIVFG